MAVKPKKNAKKRMQRGLVARSSSFLPQFEAVSPPEGVGNLLWLIRYNPLKTIRFPAVLGLCLILFFDMTREHRFWFGKLGADVMARPRQCR